MYISKTNLFIIAFAVIGLSLAGGVFFGGYTKTASAETVCAVDQATLVRLYDAILHRPLDVGASFHLGKPLYEVLGVISDSPEYTIYSGLYKSVKALEEAKRNPDGLSDASKQQYLDIINSALSTISAWASTLPQQTIDKRVVGPDQAKSAIQAAYDTRLSLTAQVSAQYGLFNPERRLGQPINLPIPILPLQSTN